MTTFVGPHYEFDLKQIEVIARFTNDQWIVTVPYLELIAIGDPGEEQEAVMAALGEALCELWCVFVCENEVAFRSAHDEYLAKKLMMMLSDVRERMSDPASHPKGLPSRMTRRRLAALRRPDQKSIFDEPEDDEL